MNLDLSKTFDDYSKREEYNHMATNQEDNGDVRCHKHRKFSPPKWYIWNFRLSITTSETHFPHQTCHN